MGNKKRINISAIQMCSKIGDKTANFEKVLNLIKRDTSKEVDLIILPEVWTVGWACEEFRKNAENLEDSETVRFLSNIAKEYNSYIIGGSFIQKIDDETYLNTCPVLNKNGELIATYSKNHLYSYCGCAEGSFVKTGEKAVMVEINGVKIGLTICYDIRFPEIFRAYRKAGAELLVNVAAWGSKKPTPWEVLTKARAIENQAFLVALTQSGQIDETDWNIGHSRIIDYLGKTVCEIKDQQEGAMNYSIDFTEMIEYRNECTILQDIKKNYEVKII